jgi:hypothetical protein
MSSTPRYGGAILGGSAAPLNGFRNAQVVGSSPTSGSKDALWSSACTLFRSPCGTA